MKTEKHLLPSICTNENAEEAYRQARECKRYRPEVMRFEQNREEYLLSAIEDVQTLNYNPGRYFIFKVWEPKERVIMALPLYDREIQHMIVNIIEPTFERRFIYQSYACRKEKGVHKASDALSRRLYELCVVQGKNIHAISGDIHNYFGSVDHNALKTEIRRYISDKEVLILIDRIIDENGIYPEGVGIPVGNLTSQLFANVYLNIFDQYVKHVLKGPDYFRYMDNFIILKEENPSYLYNELETAGTFLNTNLKLELNPKSTVVSAKNGIDFVGYRHFPGFTIMRKSSTRRLTKLIHAFESGEVDEELFDRSVESRIGHMKHADTAGMIEEYRRKVKQAKESRTLPIITETA